MKLLPIIKRITKLGERQGKNILLVQKIITDILDNEGINYIIEKNLEMMPVWKKSALYIDGKKIDSLPTSFNSGKIESNYTITSSLISSKYFLDTAHINFNPKSSIISRANFSFAPSFAVNRKDIQKISKADKILGEVFVNKIKTELPQILVGNAKNPRNIIFSHFDSVGTGAIDNASGTAVCLGAIIQNKNILENSLFVFDGNEEISFDYPIYWGKGYRNFEKKYSRIMKKASRIVAVDCVGYSKSEIIKDEKVLKLALPLNDNKKYKEKMYLIASDYDKLMNVYHSDNDRLSLITEDYLSEAARKLNQIIGID